MGYCWQYEQTEEYLSTTRDARVTGGETHTTFDSQDIARPHCSSFSFSYNAPGSYGHRCTVDVATARIFLLSLISETEKVAPTQSLRRAEDVIGNPMGC